jgi:hypothetical protein
MADVLYLAGTVLFFAVMLAYVRACEVLGRGTAAAGEQQAS